MPSPLRPVLAGLAVLLPLAAPAFAQTGPVRLVPHRAVYDLSLAPGAGGARTITAGRGRIAFDLTGDACDGYALNFRQVTVLESSESGTRTSDLRTVNFESGDGRTFRFRNDQRTGEALGQVVDGEAERSGADPLSVRLRRPRAERVTLDGSATFPNAQMRELIAAARAGRSTFSDRVFDGSDDGRKIYEVLAVIGKRIDPATGGGEAAAKGAGLDKLPRWPVSMSYFTPGRTDGTPVYVLSFDVYDNGVSTALRLDYGEFALRGELRTLELLADKGTCKR